MGFYTNDARLVEDGDIPNRLLQKDHLDRAMNSTVP